MQGLVKTGDMVVGSGSHGAVCCGHALVGMWVTGAGTVFTNGRPVVRQLVDTCVHSCPHCGVGYAITGIPSVIIEGQQQHPQSGLVNMTCGIGITVAIGGNVI